METRSGMSRTSLRASARLVYLAQRGPDTSIVPALVRLVSHPGWSLATWDVLTSKEGPPLVAQRVLQSKSEHPGSRGAIPFSGHLACKVPFPLHERSQHFALHETQCASDIGPGEGVFASKDVSYVGTLRGKASAETGDSTYNMASASSSEVRPLDLMGVLDHNSDPIIANPSALARELAKTGLYGYTDLHSLTAAVTQVLQRKRSCPERLIEPIMLFVQGRLARSPEDQRQRIEASFRAALSHRLRPEERASVCTRAEMGSLLREIRGSHSLFAIVPPGAISHPCGRQVIDIILERSLQSPPSSDFSSVLCFPGEDSATGFWRSLCYHLAETKFGNFTDPLKESELRLTSMNEQGRIHVFAIPQLLCGFPGIVLDAQGTRQAKGYSLFIFGKGNPSLCKMPAEAVDQWRQYVFVPFCQQEIPGVKEIGFGPPTVVAPVP